MKMAQALVARMLDLVGQDTVTLNPPAAVKVGLVKTAFTPSPALTMAGITLATFTGSTPLPTATPHWDQSQDPATGELEIAAAFSGPLRWETSDTVGLNQTIYGFAVFSADSVTLYGSDLLPDGPVTLTAAGQAIEILAPKFKLIPAAVS